MAEGRARTVGTAVVVRTERLSPHMVRLVLGGEGLREFGAGGYTDHYVKLLFAPVGVNYPAPWDLDRIRADFPRAQWPRQRAYTVRSWDPAHMELTLDFVVHGDEGLAGPWAARVQPGELVRFLGPGGAYAPDPVAAGTSWWATRAPCPRSPPRWSGCRRARGSTPSWRSTARPTS